MKKLLVLIAVVCLLFSFNSITVFANEKKDFNNQSAEIVMELNSNRVLYSNNAYTKKYMASTTKILTAITIIENCNINDVVVVGKDTVGVEGSSIYLEEGEELSVKELLYGLMLRSGNDCAETLAKYCSGSIEDFARLMNSTAIKIGATNSNFVNPHGLNNDNHYTTAYDLALISCYAMKNDIFREIAGTKSIDISFSTRNYKRHLINKNKLLNDDDCTGIKTGFTKKAGRCLVSSFNKNGMELVCVVLNCAPMWEVSRNLVDETYSKFNLYNLVSSENIVGFTTDNCGKKFPLIIKNDIVLPLSTYEKENLKIEYEYPIFVDFTLNNNTEIGFIKIYCQNNLIFSEKIYTI